MEEYIRVSAKTVEDAVLEASIQLGTSSDNVEYKVIEKETKGFLGIGAKKAVIEARKKKSDEDIINEIFADKKPSASEKASEKRENRPSERVREGRKPEKEQKKEEGFQREEKKPERELKKPDRKPKKNDREFVKTDRELKVAEKETTVRENRPANQEAAAEEQEGKTPAIEFREEDFVSKTPKTPVDPKEAEERAQQFLSSLFATMDMKVEIRAEYQEDTLSVDLAGEDMGVLIGKRGQTLDSIQYLLSLVVNKGKSSYIRVKLDTENYRERRKATLENLAKNIAFKVKKTRRPVYLEPMNPYERRIIHSALQSDPYVTTHSEGEEPCRKVVVTLKKRERGSYQGRENRENRENREKTEKTEE